MVMGFGDSIRRSATSGGQGSQLEAIASDTAREDESGRKAIRLVSARDRAKKLSRPGALRVTLVDLSGEHTIRYTPLAIMSLEASVKADAELALSVPVTILPFTQSFSLAEMADAIVFGTPSVIGLSCQGWNFRQYARLLPTLRQLLPDALVVLGGNHVSHRGATLLLELPEADIVVNGEGECTFVALLKALANDTPLASVSGISFRGNDAAVVTTGERPRVRSVTDLPSPYAHSSLALSSFDVALLETNRGCPYRCAFCYWGGAVGQKLAKGELDRAREDIWAIAKAGVQTLFLCDANFGILQQDLEIAELIVAAKREFDHPDEVNVNWAKNHANRVGEIIDVLRAGGVRTSINIPLQTLSTTALQLAGRDERGRADMVAQAHRLVAEGVDVCCEMIFGMPGESIEEFRSGYDRLFFEYSTLRIHPLWILPNTDYDERRRELKIVTIKPDPESDYEAVYSHLSMSTPDLRDGLAMLFSHSVLSLLGGARMSARVCARLTGIRPSDLLVRFERFVESTDLPLARRFAELYRRLRRNAYFERELRDHKRRALYASRESTAELILRFFDSLDMKRWEFDACAEVLRLDALLLPRSDLEGSGFASSSREFAFDPMKLAKLSASDEMRKYLRDGMTGVSVEAIHRRGLRAALTGRNCDLTGSWSGRIVAVRALECASERSPLEIDAV